MKKFLPLILTLLGAVLVIIAVVFWIDSSASLEPESFGKSFRDWLTLIAGLGISLKGWIDLLRQNSQSSTATKILIEGNQPRIEIHNDAQADQFHRNAQSSLTLDPEKKEQSVKAKIILRRFIAASVREQELREIISDYFPDVELHLNSKTAVWDVINELLDYAIYQGQIVTLIDVMRKYNAYQYSIYEDQLAKLINSQKYD